MRFVREDEMTDEHRRARDVVQTIVRNKPVAVQNKGRHKPGTVARVVSERLGVKFSPSGNHVAAWRYYKVRPEKGAARPELTDDRYCVYDEPHDDYLYTDAWVKKLVKELADPATFKEVTGKASQQLPKPATNSSASAASPRTQAVGRSPDGGRGHGQRRTRRAGW